MTTTQTDIVPATLTMIDLIESGLATNDQYLAALDMAAKVKEVARELDDRIKVAVLKHLLATKGELVMGTKKWYVGREKKIKCRNVRVTLEAALTVTGGDLDQVVDCLSSGAFKPAATMKLLGEKSGTCFETTFEDELKLKTTDERFQ